MTRLTSEIRFAHPSEEQLAKLMDDLDIHWIYEPVEFVLEEKCGRTTCAFRPDFYLPEFDLFVEVTTVKQKNITIKNRKIRLLKQLYPDIKIELLRRSEVERLLSN